MTLSPSPASCAMHNCAELSYKTLVREQLEEISSLNAAMIVLVMLVVLFSLLIGIFLTLHPESLSCNHVAGHDHGKDNKDEHKQDQGEPSRRVRLVGLKAQELNGRMGWTTKFIKEGEGKGRYHVVLDGKDAPKEGNFWPKNCIEFGNKKNANNIEILSQEDQDLFNLSPVRICIVGLNAKMLNGRTGIRVRYLTEGHGYGRFHVLLDGQHEPREGNFKPKNLLILDSKETKIGLGNGSLTDTKQGSLFRVLAKFPNIGKSLKKKAKRSIQAVEHGTNVNIVNEAVSAAAQHREGFGERQNIKMNAAQRRLDKRLKSRVSNLALNVVEEARLNVIVEDRKKKLSVDNDWE